MIRFPAPRQDAVPPRLTLLIVPREIARACVKSASSGIHLGHVFDDCPPPTDKHYCIDGNVLKFVPDTAAK